MAADGLSGRDKFFFLPVGLILVGAAVWNWLHGWHDLYTLIWFLVGVNNLLLVGQRVWPRQRRYFNVLIPLAGMVLIVASAYLLWTYMRGQ
ncbi:MAG: hypothetical protein WAO22_02450 [bacterium]|nr:hypothetical protein [Bacillota bacterium]